MYAMYNRIQIDIFHQNARLNAELGVTFLNEFPGFLPDLLHGELIVVRPSVHLTPAWAYRPFSRGASASRSAVHETTTWPINIPHIQSHLTLKNPE